MATVTLPLTLEMDGLRDALALLQEIHCRLAKRHGDAFRKLDRAIEHLIEDEQFQNCIEVHWLGGGKMVAAPKGKFTEILRKAHRLGVID